jgi:Cu-Zn family superoxide dismutase
VKIMLDIVRGFQFAKKTVMRKPLMTVALIAMSSVARADLNILMNLVDEKGGSKPIGGVVVSESPYGLVFTPMLSGLPPGLHGFHVHENPSCAPKEKDGKMVAALGAGGHYDPMKTQHHGFPWGDGHVGDLPALYVDPQGNAANPMLAPRLKMADLKGRSLMIHMGGDNHSDHPAPLGGGGARVACGVIE